MKHLSDHPLMHSKRKLFAPMTDADRLRVHLQHLLQLDPDAVYHEPTTSDSIIVYYSSQIPVTPGGCTRIVLDPRGDRRRIGPVGFRPSPSR